MKSSNGSNVRIDGDVHSLLKKRATEERRTISAVASMLLLNALKGDQLPAVREASVVAPSMAPAALEVLPAPVPSGTLSVSVDAREIVHGHIPVHRLRNSTLRSGLYNFTQQMINDGLDQRGIELSLDEFNNRPKAHPGDLPRIYDELLRQRTARPRSGADAKDMEWQALKDGAQNGTY